MDADHDESTRAGRFLALRKRLGLTGVTFAARLNDAADACGFPRYWTPPKVTNTEKGKRHLSLEDVAVLDAIEPERGWKWFAFGQVRTADASLVKPAQRAPSGAGKRAGGTR